MTSNEETIRKFAEAFDEAFGDECKGVCITVVPELGKGPLLDDLAKLFASNDWKPLGTVIDGEGPMLPDGCHAPADETDARNEERRHLERRLRTADRAYEELSLLANHFHHARDHDGFIRAHGAAVSAHTIALTLASRLDEEKEGDD